jgi:hypothetical protein
LNADAKDERGTFLQNNDNIQMKIFCKWGSWWESGVTSVKNFVFFLVWFLLPFKQLCNQLQLSLLFSVPESQLHLNVNEMWIHKETETIGVDFKSPSGDSVPQSLGLRRRDYSATSQIIVVIRE